MNKKLGNIKIYFGKVVDVEDTEYLNRIKVYIPGITDNIETENLPWYWPWYGINYLPILDEVLPVIIFDENISTGFYGNIIDKNKSDFTELDYQYYLKIFDRLVDDKEVRLTYINEFGIEFVNDVSKIQIEIDKISFFVDLNSFIIDAESVTIGNSDNKKILLQSESTTINIEKDNITIGDTGLEYSLMGDKSVEHFKNIIAHQQAQIDDIYNILDMICNLTGTPIPMDGGAGLLSTIKVYLATVKALVATGKTTLTSENLQLQEEVKTIQSSKVQNF